jgi:hypothetical protein
VTQIETIGIEEHRERVTGADGETRIATRRRLGDRGCENEVHAEKEGKRTERETWHDVGDDDIEGFKLEWSEKHRLTKDSKDSTESKTCSGCDCTTIGCCFAPMAFGNTLLQLQLFSWNSNPLSGLQ